MTIRKLDRYIAREIVLQTSIALIALLFIFLMGPLVESTELVIRKGLPLTRLFELLMLTVPALLTFTMPVAYLFGLLVAFSRMSGDSELIAMRACGISIKRLAAPIAATALVYAVITLWISTSLMPRSNRQWRLEMLEISLHRTFTQITPRAFIQEFPDLLLYVQDVSADRRTWVRPLMIDRSDVRTRRIILAQKALIRQLNTEPPTLEITFFKGHVYEYPYASPESYRHARFEKFIKPIRLDNVQARQFPKTDREMTLHELKEAIRFRRRMKNAYTAGLEVEYQKRWAFPAATLIFAFIAFPITVRPVRSGKFYGYMIGIIIMVIAYLGIFVGEKLGDQGKIPPFLAAWNPHLLLLIVGLLLIRHLEQPWSFSKRSFLKLGSPLSRLYRRLLPMNTPMTLRFQFGYILDRYILALGFRIFIIASLALESLFLIFEAFHLIDDLVTTGTPVRVLIRYLVLAAPRIYHQILPMILMMSLMIPMAMLEKSREILAMKAHGISYYRVLLPFLMGITLMTGLDYVIQENILPAANKKADEAKRIIKGLPPNTPVGTQWAFGETGLLYHFDAFQQAKKQAFGFDVYAIDPEQWIIRQHCHAYRASFFGPRDWRTEQAWCQRFLPRPDFKTYRFARLRLPETPSYFEITQVSSEHMSSRELKEYIVRLRRKGYRTREWMVNLVFKWLLPLSNLILFPLAAALALQGAQRGIAYGIIIAIVLGFGHWVLVQLGRTLGHVEALPPMEAAVVPFLITLFLGIFFLSKVRT